MKKETITIQLPKGSDKKEMFETIAKVNGRTKTKTTPVEKSVEVEGRENAEKKVAQLKKKGAGFKGANTVEGKEDTYLINYIETVEVDNIPAEEFGKKLYVKAGFDLYARSKVVLSTQKEKEKIQKIEQETIKELQEMDEGQVV